MEELTLEVNAFAHGGSAVGRDPSGRPVFVSGAIPGETVLTAVTKDKGRYLHADLLAVLNPSPDRVEPRCPHFGTCGGCHYQHMTYARQLEAKREVVLDQLQRIGRINNPSVKPVIPSPDPWGYAIETSFSPTAEGGLGFWSPKERRVMLIDTCSILDPRLLALYQDVDLQLPGLRKLTLRLGDEDSMLAALEVDDVEPPDLEVDFPVSVAIVLPDKTAASLIGDPFLIQEVKGHRFRVSPGCFFQPNLAAAALLIDAVLGYAALEGHESVLELYSGVGMLTAFLAERAREVTAVEINENAVDDMAVNLDHLDNVSLYQGLVEEVLPALNIRPDLLVVDPGPKGLAAPVIKQLRYLVPARFIYVSSEVSTLARDSKALADAGFRLVDLQPVDVRPQNYQVDSVSLWHKT